MNRTTLAIVTLFTGLMMASQFPVHAQSLGEIADGLSDQGRNFGTLLSVLAFVLGLGMAIIGFLKFRAHSQNPNDPSNKLSTAFMLLFVGAGLVALNLTLGTGIETIFGGGDSINLDSSGIRRID